MIWNSTWVSSIILPFFISARFLRFRVKIPLCSSSLKLFSLRCSERDTLRYRESTRAVSSEGEKGLVM